MKSACIWLGCGIAAVSLSVTQRAHAQSAAAADALFEEGRTALEHGDLDVACPKLEESDRLDPANGTKFNLADCEEKRGKIATAWELYRKLTDSLPADDERLPYAKEHAAALDPRVPRIVLTLAPGAPPNTRLKVGALVLTSASLGTALPVDPGPHEFVVSSGVTSRSYTVTLTEGERRTLEVTPGVRAAESAPAATSAPVSEPAVPPRVNLRTWGYVAGGVGAAGVLLGTITGIMGLHEQSVGNDNCSDTLKRCNRTGFDANQSARSLATVSTVGFVVGVVGLGTGTYLLLTSNSQQTLAVGTRMNPESASLSLDGRW